MSLLPQSSSQQPLPAISQPEQLSVAVAELPIISGSTRDISIPKESRKTYSQLTVFVPPDRQLIMVPTSISYMSNSMIAPVQFPAPNTEFNTFESGNPVALPPYSMQRQSYEPILSVVIQDANAVSNASGNVKLLSRISQVQQHSNQTGVPATGSKRQNMLSYHVGESSATAAARPMPVAESDSNEPGPVEPTKPTKTSNGFIVFRTAFAKAHSKEKPTAGALSIIAGKIWRNFSKEEKEPYEELAAIQRGIYNAKMAQFNEDTKAYKRTNKRQRATTANPTASKKKKTSRKPSSARSVLTPSTSARARLPSNASAVSARMPVYVDSMRMFNEPDILATDVNLHATTTSSIHDYSSYGSSVMHLMQSPISLPVSVQMPVQTPAMPMASVYHSPPVSYMPQTHYPLHSLAPMDYSAAPMLPIDIQAWNTLASTVDTTEPALSFSQAVQSSVNALALDNLAVPHLPFTAAETNPYMGHSTHTNASLLDVVSSAFTTIDGHNIPANFTELNSTIPDVLSFNAAAPAFWDHEQANPH